MEDLEIFFAGHESNIRKSEIYKRDHKASARKPIPGPIRRSWSAARQNGLRRISNDEEWKSRSFPAVCAFIRRHCALPKTLFHETGGHRGHRSPYPVETCAHLYTIRPPCTSKVMRNGVPFRAAPDGGSYSHLLQILLFFIFYCCSKSICYYFEDIPFVFNR